ncbi:MAG TPA: type II toxin-antitoxin system RelE/ParE family toxin [Tepidisphaeraceae bacterium]|nr:type II toxin-antitoxin system RelE/ParE family toxin [Tepidisphaeraceae bacterium]
MGTTRDFDHWFANLSGEEQSEVIARVNLLKLMGPQLGRPHADTLNGSKHPNMKELRAGTKAAVLRIAFAFDPTRAAILLIGGNKAGVSQKRFYAQLIAKADKLYDLHLAKTKKQQKKDR